MKRLLMLLSLVGLMVGVFTGCNESGSNTTSADTNAPPPASTNK